MNRLILALVAALCVSIGTYCGVTKKCGPVPEVQRNNP